MTLGSLFDGSGGFPLAGQMNGITPIWAAEVEPYPIAVTRSRFPMMQHLGSVTEVHGDKVQPVDVITFGSPCQDLSVAGKRAGIHEGQRSNLFFEAIRIIKEMRCKTNGEYPKYAVWENVPGAFSSNNGEDFRCVLESFCNIIDETVSIPRPDKKWHISGEIMGNDYSIAWRQLDAQYWGIPQRRKRIYLVADFRDERAGKILFERESLRGNSPSRGMPGQGATADAEGSTTGSAGELIQPYVYNESGQGYWMPGFGCLRAEGENRPSRPGHLICFAQIARTLTAGNRTPCIDRDQNVVRYDARGNDDGTRCPTLTGDHENRVTNYTAVAVYRNPKIGEYVANSTASTIAARDFKSPRDLIVEHSNLPRKYVIRRLTPLECCRLQGFPDGWGVPARKDSLSDEELTFWQRVRDTCADIAGKPHKKYRAESLTKWYNSLHTDSAEYKMWGNGIALPCAEFVLAGIAEELKRN